jgi:rod shape determining protein RodA
MWNHRLIFRIDLRIIPVILALMAISLLVISATDPACHNGHENGFFTPKVLSQIQRFLLGWAVFLLFAGMDYNKMREWAWILYILTVLSLLGLFSSPLFKMSTAGTVSLLLELAFNPPNTPNLLL